MQHFGPRLALLDAPLAPTPWFTAFGVYEGHTRRVWQLVSPALVRLHTNSVTRCNNGRLAGAKRCLPLLFSCQVQKTWRMSNVHIVYRLRYLSSDTRLGLDRDTFQGK